MPVYIGGSNIGKIYIGNQKIAKVYVGRQLIYNDAVQCIQQGKLLDSSCFSRIENMSDLSAYEGYMADYPIFGCQDQGDYSSANPFDQSLSATGRLYFSPSVYGEKCTMTYRIFSSARWGSSSGYITIGSTTIIDRDDRNAVTDGYHVKPETVRTTSFIISSSNSVLTFHIEYDGTSTFWAPSVWVGVVSMKIGD